MTTLRLRLPPSIAKLNNSKQIFAWKVSGRLFLSFKSDLTMDVSQEKFVDEILYNRQLYVIGDDAMKTLSDTEILLFGVGGLGVEIAKNLVLMGIKNLSICDEKIVTVPDVGVNCFLTNDDADKSLRRADAVCPKIQELNLYVSVNVVKNPFQHQIDKERLRRYSCVILTEMDLKACIEIDKICNSMNPPVKIIMGDVFGLISWVFCNFGEDFEVKDLDGEETKDIVIEDITSGPDGKVIVNNNHNLETGNVVSFTDILGMEALNNTSHIIDVLSPKELTFAKLQNDANLGSYVRGGMCQLIKQPIKMSFRSLEEEVWDPKYENIDSLKQQSAKNVHLSMLAIHKYLKNCEKFPKCPQDVLQVVKYSRDINEKLKEPIEIDTTFIEKATMVSNGQLPAICAFLGGVISQETVKAVTKKFTPLMQWLHFDTTELYCAESTEQYCNSLSRYDKVRICLGEDVLKSLSDANIFMIGCGAIGCEMLKNYAMLGIATRNGKIVVTDHDFIEKSNLNRQFLFRNHHMQKPKSVIAAASILQINPDLNITAHQFKVCQESENIYNEDFLKSQLVIVNALDNLEARRYVDQRCLLIGKPFLESGTMGCKGHVQVVVPHLTENYSAQSDPLDNDYPYCTIKSFPTQIEHTAQWANEKFHSLFDLKPARCRKFIANHNIHEVIERLTLGEKIEGSYHVIRDLTNRPCTIQDCLHIARLKFEKYFNHKAKILLHYFPEDKQIEDGNLSIPFWHSPRRPPKPLKFDVDNELHYTFVISMAKLLANAWNVPITQIEQSKELILSTKVPEFQPRDDKVVVTDESVVAPDPMEVDHDEDSLVLAKQLSKACENLEGIGSFNPFSYDKDLDSHLDFVYAATNLRASMYKLPLAPRLKIKLLSGRIIPAIASTTSAIAGLVTIELIKLLKEMKLRSDYRNWFLNLGLSSFISAEPAAPVQMQLGPNIKYTVWDKWCLYGKQDVTLQQVLQMALDKFKLKPSMIVQGARIVWWPILPGHNNRVFKKFRELIDIAPDVGYVDLSLTFEVDNESDYGAPLIRLVFQD